MSKHTDATTGPELVRRDALLARALAVWGADAQMALVQEECAELIAMISRRARLRCSDRDVADEVADVLIMATQARSIIGAAEVDAAIVRKLRRLEHRVTEAERKQLDGIFEAFDRGDVYGPSK